MCMYWFFFLFQYTKDLPTLESWIEKRCSESTKSNARYISIIINNKWTIFMDLDFIWAWKHHNWEFPVKLNLGIWYLAESKKWTLGALKDLEKGPFLQGGIVSKNIEIHDNPQNILNWDYYYDGGYKSPNDVNDIILECIDNI